jgi:hypothetical protein
LSELMRIAVTGGRYYEARSFVEAALSNALARYGKFILIHGDCPSGLDRIASNWSRRQAGKVFEVRCPADWNDPSLRLVGAAKMAGFARNETMLREFRPKLLMAFPGSSGTRNCVDTAKALGIPIRMMSDTAGDLEGTMVLE